MLPVACLMQHVKTPENYWPTDNALNWLSFSISSIACILLLRHCHSPTKANSIHPALWVALYTQRAVYWLKVVYYYAGMEPHYMACSTWRKDAASSNLQFSVVIAINWSTCTVKACCVSIFCNYAFHFVFLSRFIISSYKAASPFPPLAASI